MTIEIIISSAVVGAVISLIGSIITAKIAQKTAIKAAQEATNQEIKKMERTWEREDIVSSDEEFAAMAEAVGKYVHRNNFENVRMLRAKLRQFARKNMAGWEKFSTTCIAIWMSAI